MGSAWVANIAVSSANVPIVVSLDIGRSDVYSMYSSGPRMLPWGMASSPVIGTCVVR